ncbi:hypothetical protein PoB_003032100 [Plakobranchus ocellatus]|uniref:Uncharacterized protein n=1 Tax=Plakobranchus ocellatus TaxID=259542 RepID=A0AAV4A6B8_9GAST|nr:hypothetical protein PoB_003032100 [Plakobranchus ocellatus]
MLHAIITRGSEDAAVLIADSGRARPLLRLGFVVTKSECKTICAEKTRTHAVVPCARKQWETTTTTVISSGSGGRIRRGQKLQNT